MVDGIFKTIVVHMLRLLVVVVIIAGLLAYAIFRREYKTTVWEVELYGHPATVSVTKSSRPGFLLGHGIQLLPYSGDYRYDIEVKSKGTTQSFSLRTAPKAIWTDRGRLYVITFWPEDWMLAEVTKSGESITVPVSEWDKMPPHSARWNLIENREESQREYNADFELFIQ